MTETQVLTKHEKSLSAIIHASTFTKFFIPFGNFILPLILWNANKKEGSFIDHNGKEALNFQLSMLLYTVLLGIITIPFFIGALPALFHGGYFNFPYFFESNGFEIDFGANGFKPFSFLLPLGISGIAYTSLAIINFIYTLLAIIRTGDGQHFTYPVTIKFIK